eukprot:TRINITY_DN23904_c3_g1_i1.p1 TRINITY_DN23904_c3_g1~~TRINITY_DN23904_c3_g1_i1.p1  ORF type:complete len:880 (+),score=250.20 TRINITY_DN23904_c3_g1_i1:88-2727(+)
MAVDPAQAPASVLCLHGCEQDAEVFSQRLSQLRKRSAGLLDFHFVDAPFELPIQEGCDVAMRTWWRYVRDGVQRGDLERAVETARKVYVEENCVGILGFSQGASLATLLLLLADGDTECAAWLRGCKFAVLAGAVVSERELAVAAEMGAADSLSSCVPVLSFAGERDSVVSCAETAAATALLGDVPVRHPQAHVFPQRLVDRNEVMEVVSEAVRRRPEELRIDAADGRMYPLTDFIVEYGGSARRPPAEWVGARPDPRAAEPEPEPYREEDEPAGGDLPEEVVQELETLSSILGDRLHRTGTRRVAAEVDVQAGPFAEAAVHVEFSLPGGYPDVPPRVLLREAKGKPGWVRKSRWYSSLQEAAATAAESLAGTPSLWGIMDAVREFVEGLEEEAAGSGQQSMTQEDVSKRALQAMLDESDTERAANARAAMEAAAAVPLRPEDWVSAWGKGGEWKFVVGLVGKPSAGKSTLFNAATGDDRAARVAPHPFTTIDPNVGEGYAPCPSPHRDHGVPDEECAALHGLLAGERAARFVPIQVRDVAGLVPGAYQGRGKGNQFLDDLVDADVLIQVVDASGTTDAEGNAKDGSAKGAPGRTADVSEEVHWVRAEIHQWIYGNLRRRWESLRKRPQRLPVMFSGYHATEAVVLMAAERAGLEVSGPQALLSWTPQMLHLLVAHFIRLRFPVLVAMNKLDLASTAANVAAARRKLPHEAIAAISAHTETELVRLRREGCVRYTVGAPPVGELPGDVRQFLEANQWSSGVPEALATAVALRPCVRVFPVTNTATLDAFGQGPLAHCLLLRPGSSAEDLYRVLKRKRMLDGDFIRSVTRSPAGAEAPIKKDATLPQDAVIRIMTNRKSKWQAQHQRTHGAPCATSDSAQ